MPDTFSDGDLLLTKFPSLGPYDNNAYIIADKRSNEALIVDMPMGSQAVLDAVLDLRADARPSGRIVGVALTHTHSDHWANYDLVKDTVSAPILCHPAERLMPAEKIDRPLADGEAIHVGGLTVLAIHTPGHTPGSTCYLAGKFLLSGDVLFPGGPGRTQTPGDLRQSIASITSRLHTLPDDTPVLPGHGANTTIGDSRREYAAFASREHPPDLCGDVTWAG